MRKFGHFFLIAAFIALSVSWMRAENLDKDVGKMTYATAVEKWGKPDSKKKFENGRIIARWTKIEPYPMPIYDTTYYTHVPTWQQDMQRNRTTSELTLYFNSKGILSDWNQEEQ